MDAGLCCGLRLLRVGKMRAHPTVKECISKDHYVIYRQLRHW